VRQLCRELQIPPLRSYGVQEHDVPTLVAKAAQASSTKGNPIPLTADELQEMLTRAL